MTFDDFKVLVKLFGPLIFGFIGIFLFLKLAFSLQDSITLCWYSDAECLASIGWGK